MEIITTLSNFWNQISLPLSLNQIMLVLSVTLLCLIFNRTKLAIVSLASAFLFWAYQSNKAGMTNMVEGSPVGMMASLSIVLMMTFLIVMAVRDQSY